MVYYYFYICSVEDWMTLNILSHPVGTIKLIGADMSCYTTAFYSSGPGSAWVLHTCG